MSTLYSFETLSQAGIPLFLCTTGSHKPSVVDLRTAVCFSLVVVLHHPGIYVASLLNIDPSAVSRHLKRHYRLYLHDSDYTDVYDSCIARLKKAGLL